MLTRDELREMRALAQRVKDGSTSHKDWADLAALSLIYEGDALVTAIAAEGFDTFLVKTGPIWRGHAFRHKDFKRIYQRVCEAAQRVVRDQVH
jgi:hypothetical protein